MTTPTELKTERLLLRPFRLSDIDAVLEYASDPLWAGFYPRPYDRGATEHMVARAVLASWDRQAKFAMVLDNRMVGLVDLTVDPEHQTAELGFDLAKALWGQGIAVEAAGRSCRLGLPRVRTREGLRPRRPAEHALPKGNGKAWNDARRDAPECRIPAG